MGKGVFISLEGMDGCGKTTQARCLAEALEKREISALLLHEPGGTVLGERIRSVLLDRELLGNVDPLAELLLYEAARAQIVSEVIEPALAKGTVVICDRFFDSTLAYQGFGRGLDHDLIERLNSIASRGRTPDRTLLFELGEEEARERVLVRQNLTPDRMESEGDAFRRAVNKGFEALADAHPGRIVRIDANGSPGEVHKRVLGALEDLLGWALGETATNSPQGYVTDSNEPMNRENS